MHKWSLPNGAWKDNMFMVSKRDFFKFYRGIVMSIMYTWKISKQHRFYRLFLLPSWNISNAL